MLSLTPLQIVAASLIIAAGALLQGCVGFGMGLIAGPVLLLIDQALVPGPVLVLGLVLAVLMAIRERQSLDLVGLGWGLGGRLVGSVAAALVLASLSPRGLIVALAAPVLVAVVLSISGLRFRPTPLALVGAGTLSGFMSTTSSAGGPPLALLYQDASGPRLRSTMAGYFTVGTLISLGALAAVGRFGKAELVAALLFLPGMLAGYALSARAQRLLDRGYVRIAVLLVSAATSVSVIVKALL